jgi:hypothetical protein
MFLFGLGFGLGFVLGFGLGFVLGFSLGPVRLGAALAQIVLLSVFT